jgi:hypothetical protein
MRSRARLLALAATGLLALVPACVAKPPDKPPKPKPPELELLTPSQQVALAEKKIRIGVVSKQGDRVRVQANLVVEGIPDDFHFALKPRSKPLRDGEAKVSFRLSQRQREVLAFGEQACMRADVSATAKVGKRSGTLDAALAKSPGC